MRKPGFRRQSRENRFAFQAKPSGSLLTSGVRKNIAQRAKSEKPTSRNATRTGVAVRDYRNPNDILPSGNMKYFLTEM